MHNPRSHSTLAAVALFALTLGSAQAVTVSFVGSNPLTSPTYSTEFDSLAQMIESAPQTLDGFVFDQPFGDPNDIWTTYNPGGGNGKGWYPDGGDFGYTQITLASNANFGDVSLFVGSGNSGHFYLAYDLLDNGNSVASGVLSGHSTPFHWLSITGGGFDTIRLRDGASSTLSVGDGSHNALAFDQVNAGTSTNSVPDGGASLLLLGFGLAGLAALRRR